MKSWLGYILILASASMYGMSSIIIKYTYSTGLSPIPVLIIQSIIGLVLAWFWVLISGKKAKIPAPLVPSMVCQGAIGYFLSFTLFYSALGILGVALATLLLFIYPVFVVMYEIVFLHRQISLYEKVALVMAVVGLVFCLDLLKVLPGSVTGLGVILALCSAVATAFLNINGEKLLKSFEAPVIAAWSLTFSTPMLLFIYHPGQLLSFSLNWLQVGLLITGAIAIFIPAIVYLAGIRRIGAGAASIVSTAEIPLTLLLAWAILNELLNGWQVFGGILITLSIAILYYYRSE